jgi:phage terminase large subunit
LEETKDLNPNFWKVFGLGEWGSLEYVIYNNWREARVYPVPEETIFGCDFGFNVPTTIVECGLKPEGVYLKERLYESGMTNEQLIEFIHSYLPPNSLIYCDCAEPARIAEMRNKNIDARPADKSVKDGIDFCKRQNLFITSDSVNILKEIRAYTYKIRDEQVLDEPLKFNDHAMDAFRYALYTHLGKRREYAVVF